MTRSELAKLRAESVNSHFPALKRHQLHGDGDDDDDDDIYEEGDEVTTRIQIRKIISDVNACK